MKKFFLAIIGSGPAGYAAAIYAAQKGVSVALIEASDLGGTCLNHGCIPTKFLLARAHFFQSLRFSEQFQIKTSSSTIDFSLMVETKNSEIKNLRKGLESLLLSNGISLFFGPASFVDSHTLKVKGKEEQLIQAEKIIIATGSTHVEMECCPIDEIDIYSSKGLLLETQLPKELLIIGGGYIGTEFADLFSSLGTSVTLVECAERILPKQEPFLSEHAKKILEKKKVNVMTNTHVTKVEKKDGRVHVEFGHEKMSFEKVLVAIGRKPFLPQNLNLNIFPSLGFTKHGFIETKKTLQTSIDHIYAIGDITGHSLLAHGATFEAKIAAYHACGETISLLEKKLIPAVIFTDPEMASVGATEDELKAESINYISAIYPLKAMGKFCINHQPGFAKILADRSSHKILGAHVVASRAADLIGEMVLAIESNKTLEDFSNIIHPHPTDSEIWHEAVQLALEKPIHFPPKRRPT